MVIYLGPDPIYLLIAFGSVNESCPMEPLKVGHCHYSNIVCVYHPSTPTNMTLDQVCLAKKKEHIGMGERLAPENRCA